MELEDRTPVAPGAADTLLDGRYRLGEVLGRGGVATVYAAVDVLLGRAVAVKIFRPAGSRLALYRFAAEARLLAGLSHPGLVTVHDVRLEGDRPYLVMHLVAGSTLRVLMDGGPLDPAVTARIGTRIADVLAYIHARDIVHRDVKPSNVLVDGAGDGYLADFGIARALDAAHLTMSGELIGTAAYLAPEQVTDVDVSPKADVYALGLVLLECLTGRTEYTGTTVESAVARLSRQPRVGEEVPPAWRGLLTAMTAREPADRPDAAQCAGLLAALTRDPTTVIPLLRPRRESKLPRAAVLLAALAGAVVFGVSSSTVTVPTTPRDDSTGTPPPAAPAEAGPRNADRAPAKAPPPADPVAEELGVTEPAAVRPVSARPAPPPPALTQPTVSRPTGTLTPVTDRAEEAKAKGRANRPSAPGPGLRGRVQG